MNFKILFASFLLLFAVDFTLNAGNQPKDKISKLGVYEGYSEPQYKKWDYHSLYIPMEDSTLIAIDVFLPKNLEEGKKIPTIGYFMRYVRSVQLKKFFRFAGNPFLITVPKEEIDFFTSHGYACVVVDLRGSGASFGTRTMEFSDAEVKDMAKVVDWIVAQDWCDGNVGSTGISYTATTAELLLANQHPNVKACIPRNGIFDLYEHMVFPGGVAQGPFIDIWGQTTKALDEAKFEVFDKKARMFVKGISPVSGDKGGVLLQKAMAERNNFDVFEGMKKITFRDQLHPDLKVNINHYSIHDKKEAIEASGTPIYRISGWFDGALMKSALYGFLNTDNTEKVLIGPWEHGHMHNLSPFHDKKDKKREEFDIYSEMLRFFDHYLKGVDNGIDREPPVAYYELGTERFIQTATWSSIDSKYEEFFIGDNGLSYAPFPQQAFVDSVAMDTSLGTGQYSKYNSLTALYHNGYTTYDESSGIRRSIHSWDSPSFDKDLMITGHPIMELFISTTGAEDATVFVYLEDVAPDGSVTYITEGMFRAIHRKIDPDPDYVVHGPAHSFNMADALPLKDNEVAKLAFELQPVAYEIRKGHSLRLSVAGCDVDHFDLIDDRPKMFKVHFGGNYNSSVVIPFSSLHSADNPRED